MIRVARTAAAPDVLVRIGGLGERERQRAEAHFAQPVRKAKRPKKAVAGSRAGARKRPGKPSFSFRVYRHATVKTALETLFGTKCAYCESVYSATAPVDVEHWRPKGAVITATGARLRTGYYWLASEWANLLPSCIDCNRERRQRTSPSGHLRRSGKAEHFPLADETARATRQAEIAREQPLLLDPCADDPVDHLEFFESNGQKALIRPVNRSPRGKASIEVFGLNRMGLVDERRYHLVQIEERLADLRVILGVLNAGAVAPPFAQQLDDRLQVILKHLRDLRSPRSRYAALAKSVIDPELSALGIPVP